MVVIRYANLAACLLALALLGGGNLTPPLKVRFQLADGVRLNGEMTAWDAEGFDGSFGRRLWVDLAVDDAWRLQQRVMNADSAGDWLDLGRTMLLMAHHQPKAADNAEFAFRKALKIDPAAQARIDAIRAEMEAIDQARREAARATAAQKLKTTSPEAESWSADPWPVLTESELAAAVTAMRAAAADLLKQFGTFEPLETEHYLVYTDLPRAEGALLALRLDHIFKSLHTILQSAGKQPHGYRPFGKTVAFIWSEQDRFRLMEAGTFKYLVPNSAVGMTHFNGAQSFIHLHRQADDAEFDWALARQATFAYLHRYRTPKRLPAWANEGFADFIAATGAKDDRVADERRAKAIEFIRAGGNVSALLDLAYENATWPDPNDAGSSVGRLLIELMLREKPQRFARWMIAVKDGEDWQEALRQHYRTPRAELVEVFTRYSMVND